MNKAGRWCRESARLSSALVRLVAGHPVTRAEAVDARAKFLFLTLEPLVITLARRKFCQEPFDQGGYGSVLFGSLDPGPAVNFIVHGYCDIFHVLTVPQEHRRRERISDASLGEAVRRAERGLIDADLGGGVIKQRVARPGQGRSGGYRALIAYRPKARAVFVFGFAKSAPDNVDEDELATLRDIAKGWLEAEAQALARALAQGLIQEVRYDKEEDA